MHGNGEEGAKYFKCIHNINTGHLICTRIFGVGECVGFCFNDADCMM